MSLRTWIVDRLSPKADPVPQPSIDRREQVRREMRDQAAANRNWHRDPTAMSETGFRSTNRMAPYAGQKYGLIDYPQLSSYDYTRLRRNARGVTTESTIGRSLITRFLTHVINAGMSWESTPIWDMIPDAPPEADPGAETDPRYEWTKTVEHQWSLYAGSAEADVTGRQTFNELQRLIYRLYKTDGEVTGIIRYLDGVQRMSPVSVQLIKPGQITLPGSLELKAISDRGGSVRHGIEYDAIGTMIALHIMDPKRSATVRVAMFGQQSRRRFFSRVANIEDIGQDRGLPEFANLVYELNRLTEYDIAELEAVVANAVLLGAIETDAGEPAPPPFIRPIDSNADTTDGDNVQGGIDTVEIDKRALILNRLAPGQKMKMMEMSRPNQNFAEFHDAVLTYVAGSLGMPVSVLKQTFSSNYSASRAEMLSWWQTVEVERQLMVSGIFDEIRESWFAEAVRAGTITAPGFDIPVVRRAWLAGTWNGISRPQIDPVKEVLAVQKRLHLGHTTGEREAKIYNGSDYRENVERLTTENQQLATATEPITDTENIRRG